MSFEVVDECTWSPKDNDEKALCVHKLRFDDGREEYRIGYYMIGKKGKGRGKWLWAQYAPMMHAVDLKHLFDLARKKDWI
ncbi:hypothetical protein FJY69_04010 [candidate division WOR-3 bacterium]|nr:hypothetical protein [candidate division WOR-3 bacterium]